MSNKKGKQTNRFWEQKKTEKESLRDNPRPRKKRKLKIAEGIKRQNRHSKRENVELVEVNVKSSRSEGSK